MIESNDIRGVFCEPQLRTAKKEQLVRACTLEIFIVLILVIYDIHT